MPILCLRRLAEPEKWVQDEATDTDIGVGTGGGGASGQKAYVSNQGADTVSVLNTNTNTVTATVNVGRSHSGVAVNQAGTRACVVNSSSNTASVGGVKSFV